MEDLPRASCRMHTLGLSCAFRTLVITHCYAEDSNVQDIVRLDEACRSIDLASSSASRPEDKTMILSEVRALDRTPQSMPASHHPSHPITPPISGPWGPRHKDDAGGGSGGALPCHPP